MAKGNRGKVESLQDAMIKNAKLNEIRNLQQKIKLELKGKKAGEDEKIYISFTTQYWSWHPFLHTERSMDAGSLYFDQCEYVSSIDDLIQSLILARLINNYIKDYEIDDIKSLEELVVSTVETANKQG